MRYSSTLSLTFVGGNRHAPAALPPRMTQYPLYRSLGGPQGMSGRVRKISPPTGGLYRRTVQPVASRYTDWAIAVHMLTLLEVVTFCWNRNVWSTHKVQDKGHLFLTSADDRIRMLSGPECPDVSLWPYLSVGAATACLPAAVLSLLNSNRQILV
jgi:hypothetical protein